MPKKNVIGEAKYPDIDDGRKKFADTKPHFHNGTDSPLVDVRNAKRLGVLTKHSVAVTTGVQTVSNTATWTAVTFLTEVFDPTSNHSTIINTSRIQPTEGGIWEVHGYIDWEADTTGIRGLALYKNGAVVTEYWNRADGSGNVSNVLVWVISLTSADYIELYAYQSSGGGLDIDNGLFSAKLLGYV